MEFKDTVHIFASYPFVLTIIGIAILSASVLPRLLSKFPFSMPIIFIIFGYLIYLLPFDVIVPNHKLHSIYIEKITEIAVLIAIMGAGLKIKRIPSFENWSTTIRLLLITMVLTIVLTAFLGWWIAGFVPATALLLGAVIAPTDPVLASETEVEGPGEKEEIKSELKFALTSEAGLNDGLAFPFVNMALAIAMFGLNPQNWFTTWFLGNVLFETAIALVIGGVLGYFLARYILNLPAKTPFAKSIIGIGSFASTLIIYGITEFFGGYGFLAVFIGAVMIRQYERNHEHQIPLHAFIEKAQLLVTPLLLLGLGLAIGGGVLKDIDFTLIIVALLLLFFIRPICGLLGLIGLKNISFKERLAISFLGIRGFGSVYYLSYAINHQTFEGSDRLWSLVILTIVLSIFIHGITASPILKRLN